MASKVKRADDAAEIRRLAEKIVDLMGSKTPTLHGLAREADLEPATDFVGADLSDLDLSQEEWEALSGKTQDQSRPKSAMQGLSDKQVRKILKSFGLDGVPKTQWEKALLETAGRLAPVMSFPKHGWHEGVDRADLPRQVTKDLSSKSKGQARFSFKDRERLVQFGPTISVGLAHPNMPSSRPILGDLVGLIDTATETLVLNNDLSPELLRSLQPVAYRPLSNDQPGEIYAVDLVVPSIGARITTEAFFAPLVGYDVLIGRSCLKDYELTYNGATGEVALRRP